MKNEPAITRISLLARARVLLFSMAVRAAWSPAVPTMAMSTVWTWFNEQRYSSPSGPKWS